MKLRFCSARSYSEHVTDFFVREPLDVVEDEHTARAGREKLDRCLEVDRQSWPDITQGCHVHYIIEILDFLNAVHAPPIRLSLIEHHVDRKPVQPCSKGALPAKLTELVPNPHEHVLSKFFGTCPVVDHACANGKHPVHVRPVQPLKCATVSGRCQGDLGVLTVEHFRIRFRAPDWHLLSLTAGSRRRFEQAGSGQRAAATGNGQRGVGGAQCAPATRCPLPAARFSEALAVLRSTTASRSG